MLFPTLRPDLTKYRRGKSWDCSLHTRRKVANSPMPNLATWIRPKDETWFQTFFVRHPDVRVCDARKADVSMDQLDGLLLAGGSDIAPEFLCQEIINPTLIDKDVDPVRDGWAFEAISKWLGGGGRTL